MASFFLSVCVDALFISSVIVFPSAQVLCGAGTDIYRVLNPGLVGSVEVLSLQPGTLLHIDMT